MLTRLRVRNFKNLGEIDLELGQTVVLIGPNNSGKTSALQALALWRAAIVALVRAGGSADLASGPTIINRLSLTLVPVNAARFLWRDGRFTAVAGSATVGTELTGDPVYIDIIVDGQSDAGHWVCGVRLEFANDETVACRLLNPDGMSGSSALSDAARCAVAFLPPMSGIMAEEPEVPPGRIDVLVGEGQTAQILRNLCLRVFERSPAAWDAIAARIQHAFGVLLRPPVRDTARGSIILHYDQHGISLDIAAAGRGMQQTLLLLAHLQANPGAVLLLDEPDAHLEILRQRETYNLLTETAAATGSQIIAASHSEVILNEAAERDTVIAFVGTPHPLIGRGSQLRKALAEIGFDQYYQAELKGAVLYLEGATDLSILRALAKRLNHPALAALEAPFVKYVANQPRAAEHHFQGLREAHPNLRGFALFDRLERGLPSPFSLSAHAWRRREIENYIADRLTLLAFAGDNATHQDVMRRTLDELERASSVFGRDLWSDDAKLSDDVLSPIFANFYQALGLTNLMAKTDYHALAAFKDPTTIDPEVTEVLDKLLTTIGPTTRG